MFDIGWTEIIVVIIVGCLVLDIKDIPAIIKVTKRAIRHCNDFLNEIKKLFTEIDKEAKVVKRTIIDLDGNEQIAYDLDDITPDIFSSTKKSVANNTPGIIHGKLPSSGITLANNDNNEIENDKK